MGFSREPAVAADAGKAGIGGDWLGDDSIRGRRFTLARDDSKHAVSDTIDRPS
jgi:hypothetical protein